jgi:hypothetical protein
MRNIRCRGNPREVITVAERSFPVRIRIGVPPGGLGQRYSHIASWLDENCGSDGWAMRPSGLRGVLNDAVSIYFADATLASAFVARWCAGSKIETARGVFQVREAEAGAADRGRAASDAMTAGEMQSSTRIMDQRSPAAYHRAAAARARRLRAEATTRWLKEHLEDAIARHEQIAEEIERASEPDADATSPQEETAAVSSETPG